MLKYLVSCGFDINYKSENNINVYLFAAQHGQIEMLKYLDTTTIDKNTKDTNGNNAYLYAAAHGHIDVLKYFGNKFDIHIKNRHVKNAYYLAALRNNIDVMIYLESLNINIYEKDNNYCNVYDASLIKFDFWKTPINKYSEYLDGEKIREYLESKVLYNGFSKICSICYIDKNYKFLPCKNIFITCKNNHIVHLKCQQKHDRNRCLMCSAKYLI
jgi:ankyrin repeat protein